MLVIKNKNELFDKVEYDLENGMGYCESFRSFGFNKEDEFLVLIKEFKKWELEKFGWNEEEDVEEFNEEDRKLLRSL